MWTQIRLFHMEPSYLGSHYLHVINIDKCVLLYKAYLLVLRSGSSIRASENFNNKAPRKKRIKKCRLLKSSAANNCLTLPTN